jgi:hypothetical protein
LRGPEVYVFIVLTAVEFAKRALAGDAPPGFPDPAQAYRSERLSAVPGVELEDLCS